MTLIIVTKCYILDVGTVVEIRIILGYDEGLNSRLERIELAQEAIMVTQQEIVDQLTAEGATLDTFGATIGVIKTDVDAIKAAIGNNDLTAAKTAADSLDTKLTAVNTALNDLKTDAESS